MENKLMRHEPPTIEYEEHEIVYRHCYVDNKGKRYPLEEPIVCRQLTAIGERWSQPLLINEILDKLKHFMLQQVNTNLQVDIERWEKENATE